MITTHHAAINAVPAIPAMTAQSIPPPTECTRLPAITPLPTLINTVQIHAPMTSPSLEEARLLLTGTLAVLSFEDLHTPAVPNEGDRPEGAPPRPHRHHPP